MNLRSNLWVESAERRKNEKEADKIESLWPYAIVTALNCVSFPIFFASSIYCSRSPQWHNFHSPSSSCSSHSPPYITWSIWIECETRWRQQRQSSSDPIIMVRSSFLSFFIFAQAEEILKWINLLCKFFVPLFRASNEEWKKLTAAA